jgi:hypothetical protein
MFAWQGKHFRGAFVPDDSEHVSLAGLSQKRAVRSALFPISSRCSTIYVLPGSALFRNRPLQKHKAR